VVVKGGEASVEIHLEVITHPISHITSQVSGAVNSEPNTTVSPDKLLVVIEPTADHLFLVTLQLWEVAAVLPNITWLFAASRVIGMTTIAAQHLSAAQLANRKSEARLLVW